MANHGLDKIFQTTFLQGKNYPAMARKVNIGDRVRVDLRDIVNSDPMLSPLRGMYRLTFASFFCSDLNIYGWKRDNDQLELAEQLESNNYTFNLPLRPDSAKLTKFHGPVEFTESVVLPNLYDSRFGGPCSKVPAILPSDFDYDDEEKQKAFESWIESNNLSGVGRGSLLEFLGFPAGFQGVMPSKSGEFYSTAESAVFKADSIIHYLDIMRSCYTNTQTDGDEFAVGHGSFIPYQHNIHQSVNSGRVGYSYNGDSFYTFVPLRDLDRFFKWLRTKGPEGYFFDFNRLDTAIRDLYLGSHPEEDIVFNSYSFSWYMEKNRNPFDIDDPNATLKTVDLHWHFFFCRFVWTALKPHCGLFSAQYRPDVYRNLLKFGDNVASKISTTSGSITIDTVRYANRWQQIIERFDVSGGRFTTAMRTQNGISTRQDLAVPEMLGAVTHMIDPQTITALAQTGEIGAPGSTDVGQMSSNVDSFSKHGRISFVAKTPGYFFVIFQLVPMVSYCQGIDPELRMKKFADDFNPQLTDLGFEAVPMSNYSALPTTYMQPMAELGDIPVVVPVWSSVGNQPLNEVLGRNILWSRFMTAVNSCHGEYSTCGNRDYWVNQRRFTRYYSEELHGLNKSGGLRSYPLFGGPNAVVGSVVPPDSAVILSAETVVSPYVDYMDFQYHFKDQDPYSAHWYLDLMIDYQVKSQVPKTYMGQLERY